MDVGALVTRYCNTILRLYRNFPEHRAQAARLGKITLDPAEGKAQLQAVVVHLNKQFGAKGTLPWLTKRRSSKIKK